MGFFIDTFEQDMKKVGVESNWYSLLESCFKKDPERLNFPWFKRSIPERCSWSIAKSILMETFGHRNSKVQIAVAFILGKTQQENHCFHHYFNTYGLAVKGVPHLRKFSLVHPQKRKYDYLISNFIERTLCKKVSEALNAALVDLNATKKPGTSVTWKEFEEEILKRRMDFVNLEVPHLKERKKHFPARVFPHFCR